MEPLIEHSMELAGHRTRVLELEGGGPRHRAAARLGRLRRHLAAAARRARRARGRRAIAVDLPGFGAGDAPAARARSCPQLDDFAAALVQRVGRRRAGRRGRQLARRLRGAAPRPRTPSCRSPASSRSRPAGLDMPRWFDLVERDPIVRRLLDIPVPVPTALVRQLVGGDYRQLAFSQPEGGAAPGRGRVRRATTAAPARGGAARVRPPPAARAGRRRRSTSPRSRAR